MSQYALTLQLPPVFSESSFYVSTCNRDAHAWIARWPDWPSSALLLHGPGGAGKTHLGHIWAAHTNAEVYDALPVPDALQTHALIENIERIGDERQFLHLINYSRERKFSLLLTSALPSSELPFTLPDLTSRLKALSSVGITAPDDEVLSAALRKQFSDRQLKVDEDVILFLLPRIDRSFACVAEIVDALDRKALAEHRRLTIPFVKQTLGY